MNNFTIYNAILKKELFLHKRSNLDDDDIYCIIGFLNGPKGMIKRAKKRFNYLKKGTVLTLSFKEFNIAGLYYIFIISFSENEINHSIKVLVSIEGIMSFFYLFKNPEVV